MNAACAFHAVFVHRDGGKSRNKKLKIKKFKSLNQSY
jgi:hypothetical protein